MAATHRATKVFVSYQSHDAALALEVYRALEAAGVSAWIDTEAISAGQVWLRTLESALQDATDFLLLLSREAPRRWVEAEHNAAQRRFRAGEPIRILPVMVDDGPELPTASLLRDFQSVRLRTHPGGADPEDLRALVRAVCTAREADPSATAPAPRAGSVIPPYRGLEPYEVAHSSLYFGREDAIEALVGRIAQRRRWIIVDGASGSGKSSLLNAGLIPALSRGLAAPGDRGWRFMSLRPRWDPERELARALAGLFPQWQTPDGPHAAREVLAKGGPEVLADLCGGTDGKVLLVVDQLEELFTHAGAAADAGVESSAEAGRRRFIATLVHAARVPDGNLCVVLGLRSDFWDRFSTHPQLAPTANLDGARFTVSPLGAEQLRAACEQPLRVQGGRFESPRLVERLLRDADAAEHRGAGALGAARSGTRQALPLLNAALLRLWQRARARGDTEPVLTLDDYECVGGVGGALAKGADEVLASLTEGQQELARRLVLQLVQVGRGAARDTRRSRPRDELLTGDAAQDAEIARVLHRLSGGRAGDAAADAPAPLRLLVIRGEAAPDGLGDAPGSAPAMDSLLVDLAHDALLDEWPKLRDDWLVAAREDLRRCDDIETAAEIWATRGRNRDALWGRSVLDDYGIARKGRPAAARFASGPGGLRLSERARDFLAQSVRRDREIRRTMQAIRTQAAEADAKRLRAEAETKDALAAKDREVLRRSIRMREESGGRAWQRGDLNTALGEMTEAAALLADTDTDQTGERLRVLRLRLGSLLQNHPYLERRIDIGADLVHADVSADGRRVLTLDGLGDVKLWETAAGALAAVLPRTRDAKPTYVLLSPDATLAAVVSGHRHRAPVLELWDLGGPPRLRAHRRLPGPIACVAKDLGEDCSLEFSADGSRLMAATLGTGSVFEVMGAGAGSDANGGVLQSWSTRDLESLGEPLRFARRIFDADWSADGRLAVVASFPSEESRATPAPGGSTDSTEPGTRHIEVWDTEARRRLDLDLVLPLDDTASIDYALYVGLSPDGRRLVTGYSNGNAFFALWDLPSGQLIGRPRSVAGGFQAARYVSDKLMLSVADRKPNMDAAQVDRGNLQFWATDAGFALETGQASHEGQIHSVALNSEQSLLLTGADDATVRVWHWFGGAVTPELAHGAPVKRVAFLGDARRFVTLAEDGSLRLWDLERNALGEPSRGGAWAISALGLNGLSPRMLETLGRDARLTGLDLDPLGAAVSPDGCMVAGIGVDYRSESGGLAGLDLPEVVHLFSARSGLPLSPPLLHDRPVDDARFSPDGAWLVTASGLEEAPSILRGIADGPLEHAFVEPGGSLAQPRLGAAVADDSRLWIWSVPEQRLLATLVYPGRLRQFDFAADGRLLFAAGRGEGGEDGEVRVWRLPDGEPWSPAIGLPRVARKAVLTRSGERLAVLDGLGEVSVWALGEGRPARLLRRLGQGVEDLDLSADGQRLAILEGKNHRFDVVEAETGRSLLLGDTRLPDVERIALTPDGEIAVVITFPGTADYTQQGGIEGWSIAQGRRLWDVATASGPMDLAMSPTGALVAVAEADGRLSVLESISGVPAAIGIGTAEWLISGLRFTGDGARLSFRSDHNRELFAMDLSGGARTLGELTAAARRLLGKPEAAVPATEATAGAAGLAQSAVGQARQVQRLIFEGRNREALAAAQGLMGTGLEVPMAQSLGLSAIAARDWRAAADWARVAVAADPLAYGVVNRILYVRTLARLDAQAASIQAESARGMFEGQDALGYPEGSIEVFAPILDEQRGLVAAELGDWDRAAALLASVKDSPMVSGSPERAARAHGRRALVHLARGTPEDLAAHRDICRGLIEAIARDGAGEEQLAWTAIACVLPLEEQVTGGRFLDALGQVPDHPEHGPHPDILLARGLLLANAGRIAPAREALQAATAVFDAGDPAFSRLLANPAYPLLVLARLDAAAGRPDDARAALARAEAWLDAEWARYNRTREPLDFTWEQRELSKRLLARAKAALGQ